VTKEGLGPVFGAVEAQFRKGLGIAGVPVTALGEPIYVPEFNATKLPIRVDVTNLTKKIEGDHPYLFDAMQAVEKHFVYSGSIF